MANLTSTSKTLLFFIVLGALAAAGYTRRSQLVAWLGGPESGGSSAAATAQAQAPPRKPGRVVAALSEWPGHMALVVGNGGLTTSPGSPAAELGLDLEIVFIEDPAQKNQALQTGAVDVVWQTVDEMPITMGSYRKAGVEARAFIQIDWSRGGDACVASREVKVVEDILGRKSAMLMFSPDHTVFEFMITNSRLGPAELEKVRADTSFSMDDFTYGRKLFAEGKVDVACLWEPDVTLALDSRPGAHRLFSTADATELVADVLLARVDFLEDSPELAEKVARVWFEGARRGKADRPAAARLIATAVPRFREELGVDKTLAALDWMEWTELDDNVRFFGLDGSRPAFDRVYNHADSIWINYPQAEIVDRFAPAGLRDDRIVTRLWEAAGRPVAARKEKYQAEVALTGSPVFTKPISVNFKLASAKLDVAAMAVLNNELLPQMEIARGMYLRVEGNTDNQGSAAANRFLSQRRAEAIVDFLVEKGVSRTRIAARGNGSAKPLASNKTTPGRARNRRTDILFIAAPGGA